MIYDGMNNGMNNGMNIGGMNPMMGGGAIPAGTGYQYNGFGATPTVQKNILTPEQIDMLVKKENTFSLALTETDKLKARCNHRTADGSSDTLVMEDDGTYRCTICGYKFHPVDSTMTREELQAAVNEILDILQTIKVLWIDINPKAAEEYFLLIPLLEKMPELFDISAKNFAKHFGPGQWSNNSYQATAQQLFAMLGGILSPGANPYAQPQMNPMMGQPMGQPQPAAPFANPAFQQPYMQPQPMMGPNMTNGFVMQPGYQPQTAGFQSNYGAPQPQATVAPAPAAPVADQTAPVTSDNTTANQFKA